MTAGHDRNLILGLDIGIGSCGWALLDAANHRIIDMNAHLWDPPQESKTKTSLAASRRSARSVRRNTKRTADRKKHCFKLFKQEGLVPEGATKEWLQTIKGDLQPLQSRVVGLDERLEGRAWAQALYNICSRRGYIPHGEGKSGDDPEGKKVLNAVSNNERKMVKEGWRTVGEMLHSQPTSRNRNGIYENCVTCSQLVEEVRTLFERQREFGNPNAGEGFEQKFIDCMTWQKDVTGIDERIYQRVGRCEYFKEEKRAAKATFSFELCQAHERFANTMVVMPDGTEQHLPKKMIWQAIETLFSPVEIKGNKDCKVRYSDLRKMLDLPALASFKGMEQDSENKSEVAIPKVWRSQRRLLPRGLMMRFRHDRELADAVDEALVYSSSEEVLRGRLACLDLEDDEIDAITSLPYSSKAYSGYGNRSLKALDLLIDSFEDDAIVTLHDAEMASGLGQLRQDASHEKGTVLPPYVVFDPTCTNPVVLRVMGRVRKVVNAVIRQYGMPNEIHIELARELKQSAKEKSKINRDNNATKKKRDVYRAKLAEDLQCSEEEVPKSLLRKYELWDEQGGRDIYTDEPIEVERMLADSTYCQIDHILPYSRTCDDGRMNKVLVLAKSNQDKRERSPYEWLSEAGRWDAFEKRVLSLNQTGYPYKKRLKLLEKNLAEKQDGFIERNLNDTRYASLAAKKYLEAFLRFPDDGKPDNAKRVKAVSGGATSALRSAWGFHAKNREQDDCHHAVDAAIIAACGESAVMKVAKASASKHLYPKDKRAGLFEATEPWEGFSNEVEAWAAQMIPTRMVNHSWQGRLFEDTVYRVCGEDDSGRPMIAYGDKDPKPSSNCVINADGGAVKPDGMMFLRLWWDPDAKLRGSKKPGKYLFEPVYRSDYALMAQGTYVPRSIPSNNAPRNAWPVIPEEALRGDPIVLHYGDAVAINGVPLRYISLNISNRACYFREIQGFEVPATPPKPIGSLGADDSIAVIHEDILGLCYKHLYQ